jgi:hypothetical protein
MSLDKILAELEVEEERPKREERVAKPEAKVPPPPTPKPPEAAPAKAVAPPEILPPPPKPAEKAEVAEAAREEVRKPAPAPEAQKGAAALPIEEETAAPAKTVWLIFGDKGSGKTTTAMSFPGHILVLSFDRKSAIIRLNMYNNDGRIRVFDVVKLMDYSTPDKMLESAERTFEATLQLLDAYPRVYGRPDWVVIDGAQIMQQICEWTMRKRHNIGPFDGISNLNLWKERRAYMRDIHNRALNIARCGIIYTTYTEKDRVIIAGETVHEKDVPAWVDILIYETDFVLQTVYNPVTKKFEVKVVTSKLDKLLPTGVTYDVTSRRFWEVVAKSPCLEGGRA